MKRVSKRQKHMRYVVTVLLILIGVGMATGAWADVQNADQLRVILRDKIQQRQQLAQFTCRNELICGIADLPLFYARRGFRPAWVTQRSLSTAQSLIRAIRVAGLDGLRTADYHADAIDMLLDSLIEDRLRDSPTKPETLVDLDLLLTDAFLMLGSHLMAGRVNAETIHTEWTVHHPEADLAQILESALESDQIEPALDSLRPPHHGYRALKSALNRYREIAAFGGWPLLDKQLSWQVGDFGTHIAQLRERLESTGDLGPVAESYDAGYLYDDLLTEGIRRFQARHGLPESGKVDGATFAALNVPVDVRVRQMELNLERWRWIPHDLGDPHILVNVADFNLTVVVADQPQWGMRVVVGRDYRRTPVFSADLKYLVINPYWNIPRKIAVADILPKARRDPDYLIKKRIKIFESWDENARELNPHTIDWSKVTKRNFAFKLRKEPGPFNDLGRIKFMLPNKYAVYLHDTPNRKLFKRNSRTFSSGCIRLERPLDLAGYLLKDDPKWSRKNILKAIASGKGNIIVRLGKPVPVHLLYWTAWVDHQGRVNFRDDIYRRDPLLDVALQERLPIIGPKESTQRDLVSASWTLR